MYQNPKKSESVPRFYDQLAVEYDLIYADWRKSVQWQGDILNRLIQKELDKATPSVLDCTCGIGTQAIGLAQLGYTVQGTDISHESIERAKREADSFGVSIDFNVANLLTLESQIDGLFDVVISFDNSLPHLLTDNDLQTAVGNIQSKLKPDGIFLASIRDYDDILKTMPKATMPKIFDDPGGKRIVFQVWDWSEDKRNYLVNLFIMREVLGDWKVSQHSTQYRALRRQELTDILSKAGFVNTRWLMPDETGYYQPIVISHQRT
jgi:glycine/sarcosine N-methyltransferase